MSPRLTDLRLVVGLVVAAAVSLLVPGIPWPVEWAFGLPLLMLLPGYAAVAALFPERPGTSTDGAASPDWPTRFGLSLVGSAIVVAVVGVLFASLGWVRLTLASAVISVGVVTLLAVGIAVDRRKALRRDRRADPIAGAYPGSLFDAFDTVGVQSVVLVISVVLLVSTLAFAGTVSVSEPYSEVYLTDGGDVAGPTSETRTLVAGVDNTLSLTFENHEGSQTDYRTVIQIQRVAEDGTVLASERLDDFQVGLTAGEAGVYERELTPTMTGEGLRLQVLVSKGETDGEITAESADLRLRIWTDVTDEGST